MANILIIEDDPTLQEAYGFILKKAGKHTVASAYNGAEGLTLAKSSTFDIILLDIFMPIMNGLEFLEHYSATSAPHTKVIVFSNMVEPETQQQAIRLGAHRYILKSSMTPGGMLELVKELAD